MGLYGLPQNVEHVSRAFGPVGLMMVPGGADFRFIRREIRFHTGSREVYRKNLARLELANMCDRGGFLSDPPVCEEMCDRLRVELAGHLTGGEERMDLAREKQFFSGGVVVEWLNAQWIANEIKFPFVLIQ